MIRLEQITLCQGDFCLEGIDLEIPTGQYAMLMGATGCGKTTLLEAICGLRPIESGTLWIDDRDVTRLPPSSRRIGYVPQDSALFPTMRVGDQIAFGLDVRKVSRSFRSQRVQELARLLGIEPLLKRYPGGLSGGEQQRIALARALSFKPRLLCLDEPLSALDGPTRKRMAQLLKTVYQTEKVTVLHITHSLDEASDLGTLHFRLQDQQVIPA